MNRFAYKIAHYTRSLGVGLLGGALLACCVARAGTRGDSDAANPSTMDLAGLQDRFAQIADVVTPSIVAISAVGADIPPSALRIDGNVDGPQLAAALDRVARTVGTGFIIDADGYILTAEHVVSEAEQLWITTDDKKVYPAMVVGSDPRSDLAVLKIPVHGLKPVRFADGDAVHRGQWTLTLGNPYGLATGGELAMSVGIVSATNRSLSRLSAQENRLYTDLIQTTAEINPGNSGGPLFDLEGHVIGVNAAVVLPQKNANGLGFAFAMNDALIQRILRMKSGEIVEHAYMGVSVSNAVSGNTAGARVDSVMADGPSAGSGLAVGDIVVHINDAAINGSDAFARTIASLGVNQKVTLKVLRDGSTKLFAMQTGLRPSSRTVVSRANQKFYFAGMLIGATPDGFRVQSITQSSPFRKQGIEQGAILTGVGGHKAASLSDLLTMLNEAPEGTCKVDKAPATAGAHAAANL